MTRFGLGLCLASVLVAPLAAQQTPALVDQFKNGVEALHQGRLDEAEKTFQQILATPGGESGYVRHNLGIVYQQRGDHAKAVEQFEKAIRQQPGEAGSHMLLGVSLLALGEVDKAAGQLEKAVSLDPKQPAIRLQLALAYERAGDTPNVVEQLRAVRKLEPDEPEHAYRLAKAYIDLAAWSTRRMMEVDPQSSRVHQSLGENYLVQGQLDMAERSLRRAAELAPNRPGVHWTLAQLYIRKGDTPAALRELDRELAAAPGSLMALRLKQQLEKASAASK